MLSRRRATITPRRRKQQQHRDFDWIDFRNSVAHLTDDDREYAGVASYFASRLTVSWLRPGERDWTPPEVTNLRDEQHGEVSFHTHPRSGDGYWYPSAEDLCSAIANLSSREVPRLAEVVVVPDGWIVIIERHPQKFAAWEAGGGLRWQHDLYQQLTGAGAPEGIAFTRNDLVRTAARFGLRVRFLRDPHAVEPPPPEALRPVVFTRNPAWYEGMRGGG